ncbi:hypothetical protein PHET_08401 [Paragonimus heterotremus]|uniref:Cytochrome c oxidase polypeptide VIIc n=1 Tax=Paragonimus heterotremus TaxID=100268 RepID=A0A8J4TC46_9TREM|nr:hypothetical protein PHET_08401 [Paragonimus heterotremus]
MAARGVLKFLKRSVSDVATGKKMTFHDKLMEMESHINTEGKPGGIFFFKIGNRHALLAKFILYVSTGFIPPFVCVYLHMKPPAQ